MKLQPLGLGIKYQKPNYRTESAISIFRYSPKSLTLTKHIIHLNFYHFHGSRGWWTTLLFTAALSSAKYFIQHVSKWNTLTQARRNISHHYNLAKISKEHHILEIGFGWGTLAMEVVKQTGCKYTGITLSEQQLNYAQSRVEQEGLQDMSVGTSWNILRPETVS
ncbi:uncharacterized protein LOC129894623 [Solanum dulcamara]|uniref:uncharacterized protein LOC129894623 n=1 Tax=Solanum dulcamara TaxID=45834 RepID=UPI0024851249|nr:uncharacterized protein LOC129894623 [Solanum dulcamara]